MSLADYYDELAEQALGWLGWSEDQTLAADVNAIVVGMRGRVAMFAAIFGTGENPPPASEETMTAALFDQIFG